MILIKQEQIENGFSLYNKLLDFNKYVKQYIAVQIPSVHRDLRIHLLDQMYQLSSHLFSATYNKGNIRMKYIIEMQVDVSLLDMMIDELRSIDCVSRKHLDSAVRKLSFIKNMVYAWRLNEEKKKK